MSNGSQVRAYHHASDLPQEVWRALSQNEAAANVVLPFAKKASSLPRGGNSEQLWIVVYDGTNVEFVLSCTKGPMGNYPIFIVTCKMPSQLAEEERRGKHLANSLEPLVVCLLDNVPHHRIFSVFSIATVATKFAEIFEKHTHQKYGIQALKDPYYDASLAVCTRETFVEHQDLTFPLQESENIVIALRRADMSHLEGIAAMCKAFSETSWPYILDDAGAKLEAKTMIANQQVWVHTVQREGQQPEIACIVATTRESDNVTAVTKVFTAEHWRSRGCAARLLHRVCRDVFRVHEKRRVVLYVGNSKKLASARELYRKIGFKGLEAKDEDKWLEIGFKGATLGYW